MASAREKIDAKPWEILGMYFGFFAVAKDIPTIFRILKIPNLVPHFLKVFLLGWVGSSDFWILVLFSFTSIALLSAFIWPPREIDENPEKDSVKIKTVEDGKTYEGSFREVQLAIARTKRIRVLKTFGLVLVREWLLDQLGVAFYGTFQRGSHWPLAPERWKSIDRISFDDGTGVEYQYLKDLSSIVYRYHPQGNDSFEKEVKKIPEGREALVLLLASNVYWWWLICYFLRRLNPCS